MTDQELFEAGLVAGYADQAHGVIEPEGGYLDSNAYALGVAQGREDFSRSSARMESGGHVLGKIQLSEIFRITTSV